METLHWRPSRAFEVLETFENIHSKIYKIKRRFVWFKVVGTHSNALITHLVNHLIIVETVRDRTLIAQLALTAENSNFEFRCLF